MGCDVRVAGATDEEARRIRALFDRHERRFSRFIEGSELNAVNAGAGGAIRVSRAFADMLQLSLWAARQTGGLVDPTIGSALRAAGYDRDFGDGLDRPQLPSPAVAGTGSRRATGYCACPPAWSLI
jgi:thiamine biosynthesis lipoprotein